MTTVRIQIFSIHAAVGKYKMPMWSGEISDAWFEGNLHGQEGTCNTIYRLFNRVDKGDEERLQALGYELPSLSVGDFFSFQFGDSTVRTYQVAMMGFKKVTGNFEYLTVK